MVDGAVVDAANARTNARKEARMHEQRVGHFSSLYKYTVQYMYR